MRRSASALLLAGLIATQVTPSRDLLALCKDKKPTSWDLELSPTSERGERLVVNGRVIDSEKRTPLAGITVYVYHTDAKGEYQPTGATEPRLCGTLITNAKGEYRLRTIMPGAYSGPPHIHFEVWGPNVRPSSTFVNLVKKNAPPLPLTLKELSTHRQGGDATAIARDAYRGKDGVYYCTRDLSVRVMDTSKLPVMPLPKPTR